MLELKKNDGSRNLSFYGSVSAIFDVHSQEELCCNQNILYKYGFSEDKPYENDFCRISKEVLLRRAWKPKEKLYGFFKED